MEYNSSYLERKVILDVVYPMQAGRLPSSYKVLILNDGQDLASLDYLRTLDRLHTSTSFSGVVTLAIHAGDRIQEYGVEGIPDFKGRGNKAAAYQSFLAEELTTTVFEVLGLSCAAFNVAIAGFSLGALAAFDFVWSHSDKSKIAGCFSGSFWWRSRDLGPEYSEMDRIMHQKVADSSKAPEIKVWMEVGTADEICDRNNIGVIDAINDAKDLLNELRNKGIPEHNLFYLEIDGGEHNQNTWGKVMPDFLRWAFEEN